jgi:hypothetical protein
MLEPHADGEIDLVLLQGLDRARRGQVHDIEGYGGRLGPYALT